MEGRSLDPAETEAPSRWAFEVHSALVALDFSAPSLAALELARALAPSPAPLHALYVVPPGTPAPEPAALARELASSRGGVALAGVELHVTTGEPVGKIVATASKLGTDLVALGTRAGHERLAEGSVAEEVARQAHAPTLVVREGVDTKGGLQRVLLAVDRTDPSRAAAPIARDIARRLGVPLAALHVVDVAHGSPDQVALARTRETAGIAADLGEKVEVEVAVGTPARELCRVARPTDLLVCGTHARSPALRRVFGSVALELLRRAPCPVLVVRPARTGSGRLPRPHDLSPPKEGEARKAGPV